MNISPKGMSILEAYNLFRKGELIVNRKYQRKLVWTVEEKQMLIDSILRDYPLPLFLFAKNVSSDSHRGMEILDGVQRLTSIFDFIENRISINGEYFDLEVFPAANEYQKKGIFKVDSKSKKLSTEICSEFLNYQLAVTTFESISEERMIDVFGRINSQGRQLSSQEKRQAGVINDFSEMVREISQYIRGDLSNDVLKLYDMPEISLDDNRNSMGYKVSIEDMFWYKSGVLGRTNIRNSEDEEMIADLLCSVILDKPFEVSRENLNALYDENSQLYSSMMIRLSSIGKENIKRDFLKVFEVVRTCLSEKIDGQNFRYIVSGQSRNPVKYSFYAVFMAFYRLIIKENMVPINPKEIIYHLRDLQSKLVQGRHSVKEQDRESNVKVVNGLIRDLFIRDEGKRIEQLGSEYEFEKLLSQSKTESESFEFKQGLFNLSPHKNKMKFSSKTVEKIMQTAVAMANRASSSPSYIFIGIADDKNDAEFIKENFHIDYLDVSQKFIVGVDKDLSINNDSLDSYIRRFLSEIDKHEISEDIRRQLKLCKIKNYRGKQIIEIKIEKPSDVSKFKKEIYIREGSNTVKVDSSNLDAVIAIAKRFG